MVIGRDLPVCEKIFFFPGVEKVPEPPIEPEPDLEEVVLAQDILLARWQTFAEELRRRAAGLPADLRFELCELLSATRI
jgi:hypothetical protein